jgi:hypothetical protein
MFSGSDNPAKPVIKRVIGLLIDPIIGVRVWYSNTIVVNVIPQAKNRRDSYKLLKGK